MQPVAPKTSADSDIAFDIGNKNTILSQPQRPGLTVKVVANGFDTLNIGIRDRTNEAIINMVVYIVNISAISNINAASQATSGDAVAISVTKKAMDIEKTQAQALIQSLPQPISTKGAYIDVKV